MLRFARRSNSNPGSLLGPIRDIAVQIGGPLQTALGHGREQVFDAALAELSQAQPTVKIFEQLQARRSGFPANVISEVKAIIDPATAEG